MSFRRPREHKIQRKKGGMNYEEENSFGDNAHNSDDLCGTPCVFSDNEDEINPHDP